MSVQVIFVIDEPRLKTSRSREIIDCFNQVTLIFNLDELSAMFSLVIARHSRVNGIRKLDEYRKDEDNKLTPTSRSLISLIINDSNRRYWNLPCPVDASLNRNYEISNQPLWEVLLDEAKFVIKPQFQFYFSSTDTARLRIMEGRLKDFCQQLLYESLEMGENINRLIFCYDQDPTLFKSYFSTKIYNPINSFFGNHSNAEKPLALLPTIHDFLSRAHYDALLTTFQKLKVLQPLQAKMKKKRRKMKMVGLLLQKKYLSELKVLIDQPEQFIPYFVDRSKEAGVLVKVFISSFQLFQSFLRHIVEKINILCLS